MRSIDGAIRHPATTADLPIHRDHFRAAVAALDPGPLRDVLMAVAYARDEAARTGTAVAPPGRWLAVVAAAERAAHAAEADDVGPRWAAA